MADGNVPGDFLGQYRGISNKLKKRFLRKPNVTEASEQFGSLALQCENAELPHYAGLCWSAAARCEGSLGNAPGEAWTLLRAGRQFLSAETRSTELGCLGGEHLQGAISCFTHAANRWQHHHNSEQPSTTCATPSPLAAGITLELANSLRDLDRLSEAATQYQHASGLQTGLEKLNTLGHLATCRVELGDYDGALNVFNEMVPLAATGMQCRGVYRDILHRCEVSRVLLLLILQPTGQKLNSELAKVLEKYAWGQMEKDPLEEKEDLLSEDLFILMQSLVMATQSRDLESLSFLEVELWSHISVEQKNLLRTLVRQIK